MQKAIYSFLIAKQNQNLNTYLGNVKKFLLKLFVLWLTPAWTWLEEGEMMVRGGDMGIFRIVNYPGASGQGQQVDSDLKVFTFLK